MTQDEIIEMAKQAGLGWAEGLGGMPEFLERFAKLIAQHERNACAKHLVSLSNAPDVKSYADSIRARGDNK
jgi:hypothetical protein